MILRLTVVAIYFAVVLISAYGWFSNLFALIDTFITNAPVTTLVIGRIVGLFFAPLGAALGYF